MEWPMHCSVLFLRLLLSFTCNHVFVEVNFQHWCSKEFCSGKFSEPLVRVADCYETGLSPQSATFKEEKLLFQKLMVYWQCSSSVFDTYLYVNTVSLRDKMRNFRKAVNCWINSEFKISNTSVLSVYRHIKVHPPLLCPFLSFNKVSCFLLSIVSKIAFFFSLCVTAVSWTASEGRVFRLWPEAGFCMAGSFYTEFTKWLHMQSSFGLI